MRSTAPSQNSMCDHSGPTIGNYKALCSTRYGGDCPPRIRLGVQPLQYSLWKELQLRTQPSHLSPGQSYSFAYLRYSPGTSIPRLPYQSQDWDTFLHSTSTETYLWRSVWRCGEFWLGDFSSLWLSMFPFPALPTFQPWLLQVPTKGRSLSLELLSSDTIRLLCVAYHLTHAQCHLRGKTDTGQPALFSFASQCTVTQSGYKLNGYFKFVSLS